MRVLYFSVFDKKAGVFSPVFPAPTFGAAERLMADQLRNPDSQLARWPNDFALYHLFDFDDNTAAIDGIEQPPSIVCEVVSLVDSVN